MRFLSVTNRQRAIQFSKLIQRTARPIALQTSAAMATSTSTPKTMLAAVIHEAGGPENIKLEQRPVPIPVRQFSALRHLIHVQRCSLR